MQLKKIPLDGKFGNNFCMPLEPCQDDVYTVVERKTELYIAASTGYDFEPS